MKESSEFFLRDYINSMSPSGYEKESAKLWKREAKKFAEEVHGDFHGNSFAVVGKGGKTRVMLAGHTDEIGLLISKITEEGYLFFNMIGGWDNQVLPGQRVRIKGDEREIFGVIGRKPVHLLGEQEKKNVVKVEDLWIDIGAKNKEQAESLISIGSPGVLDYNLKKLQGDLLTSRNLDNKVGGFIVLEAAKELSNINCGSEVTAVATVQEEIGVRGATTSAFRIDPHIAIAVDVWFATDTPFMEKSEREKGSVELGKGPIISRGPNTNPRLFDRMIRTAERNEIPHQVIAYPEAGSDANAIQLAKGGVATGIIFLPNRYMHSPSEVVSEKDMRNSIELIVETVKGIEEESFELF